MQKDVAQNLFKTYGEAWVKQDADLILSIFTPDAIYDEPHEPVNKGHNAIRNYWVKKVIGEQSDISFNLLAITMEGNQGVVEWNATFKDKKGEHQYDLNEIGLFTLDNGKIKTLREFYRSKKRAL